MNSPIISTRLDRNTGCDWPLAIHVALSVRLREIRED